MTTGDTAVWALIPDHPELYGRLGKAIEFSASLRHANDPLPADEGDPWRLPEQLVAPELQAALDAAVLYSWHWDVGDDGNKTGAGIDLRHAGVGHMPVYGTSVTREQLQLLVDAAAVLDQAEATPESERLPALPALREVREVREFVDVWREADADPEAHDASLSAWRIVVRLLALAIADAPTRQHRPSRLLDPEGKAVPVADAENSSPAADTALLVARIDAAGDTRPVDLDDAAYAAYERLCAEWHAAIYGPQAGSPDALLQSWTY